MIPENVYGRDGTPSVKEIAEAFQLDIDNTESLLRELDYEYDGEFIFGISPNGVYLMDLPCSINNYTMLPIPVDEFKLMLNKRKLNRLGLA